MMLMCPDKTVVPTALTMTGMVGRMLLLLNVVPRTITSRVPVPARWRHLDMILGGRELQNSYVTELFLRCGLMGVRACLFPFHYRCAARPSGPCIMAPSVRVQFDCPVAYSPFPYLRASDA